MPYEFIPPETLGPGPLDCGMIIQAVDLVSIEPVGAQDPVMSIDPVDLALQTVTINFNPSKVNGVSIVNLQMTTSLEKYPEVNATVPIVFKIYSLECETEFDSYNYSIRDAPAMINI